MDGIEVIRSMQREVNIPVIYLTANADDAHFSRAKEKHIRMPLFQNHLKNWIYSVPSN
jgi:CheY-like chemotaxis protein